MNDLVKSNVAIAAAVTSYARIHIYKYKMLAGCHYTDTDSIFTTSARICESENYLKMN